MCKSAENTQMVWQCWRKILWILIFAISLCHAIRYAIEILKYWRTMLQNIALQTGPIFHLTPTPLSRSQWHSCRSGSAAASLLGLGVRIPPGAWMSVSCEWCVGSGLCDVPIPRLEESYCARASNCVISKPEERGGLGQGKTVCRAIETKHTLYT